MGSEDVRDLINKIKYYNDVNKVIGFEQKITDLGNSEGLEIKIKIKDFKAND